jgi:tetratricopeptide (TPR) repeat protein
MESFSPVAGAFNRYSAPAASFPFAKQGVTRQERSQYFPGPAAGSFLRRDDLMYRNSHYTRGVRRRGLAARAALAVLVGGATLATPALAAKDKPAADAGKPSYSKDFIAVYKPVADIANAEGGDFAAAKTQLPAVIAAIQNQSDRNAAGSLSLVLGNKLNDRALQRQGLELMLQSGQVEPAKVGQFNFFVGSLAYDAKDYAAARTALQAALAAGYTEQDARPIIAETYFNGGAPAEGLKYLADVIQKDRAAGKKIPDSWLLRGLQVAYQSKLAPQANEFSALLVHNAPTQTNWLNALQVVQASNSLDPQAELDLLRLFRETGNLKERRDYMEYLQAADPRRMAGEVLQVLDEGVKAGALTTSDATYTDAKATATARVAIDRKDAPALATDARSAANGVTAQGAGDAFYSLGDFAKASEMYKLALDKGGLKDREMVLTRLGIAQAKQGDAAAAKATFQQVTGARAPVAAMWSAYVDSKGAAAA